MSTVRLIDKSQARRKARAGVAGLLCAAALASAGAAPAFGAGEHGPGGADFYRGPSELPSGHGKLIWQRDATKLAPVPGAALSKTILYTSKSPQGEQVVVSGSVNVPTGKPPKRGWPVISWAHGATGIADQCAPTRLRKDNPQGGYIKSIKSQLSAWIKAGYAVVATDYQGLGTPGIHPFLIGESEGRSVVDMVSAARRLDPDIGRKFLIAGHSQGGQSALFAAGLADRWAPDLRLRGTVAYAPSSHFKEQGAALPALTSPSTVSVIAAETMRGASTATDAGVKNLMTPKAQALYPQTKKRCMVQLGEPDSFGGMAPADLFKPRNRPTPVNDVVADMNPAVAIGPPVLLAQGSEDQLLPPFYTQLLATELTNLGGTVTYSLYPGADHEGIVAAAEPEVLAFFEKRLPAG